MANISEYLTKIRAAVYGEEVRSSIHDAINAINTESSGMNTQASEALKEAQRLSEEAKSSLSEFQLAVDKVEKEEKSISEKVSDLMQKRIHDELLDSTGGNVMDNTGQNILTTAVFSDEGEVADIEERLKLLEDSYNSHLKSQFMNDSANEEVLSDFADMKQNLAAGYWFSDDLLDSSGNQIRDSTGAVIMGQTVLADRHMVDALSSRVAAIENTLYTIIKHAVFDSY